MNGKSNAIQGFFQMAELVDELRKLCRTDQDGGSAAYVRLAADDPMDHDAAAGPMLAVAVADIERILDRFTFTILTFDEAADDSSFVAGETGRGKDGGNSFRQMLDKIARLGRAGR